MRSILQAKFLDQLTEVEGLRAASGLGKPLEAGAYLIVAVQREVTQY